MQKLDFYFDIKDLVCITLGILLPVSPLQQDRLDFVHFNEMTWTLVEGQMCSFGDFLQRSQIMWQTSY